MKACIPLLVLLAAGLGSAAAQPRIPSSDLPGRERERFVDPPGSSLIYPSQPSTTLPYEARRPGCEIQPRGKHARKRCTSRR